MKAKEDKTNVMRLLEQKKITYKAYAFEDLETTNGQEIAAALGEDENRVFKTLVTQGKSGQHYVFVIPVDRELDLKKAAKAASEKSVAMIKQKDLLPLTGYVHGGCSPIGMKKVFPTTFHVTANDYDTIYFSAGKIGHQVELHLSDIAKLLRYSVADVVTE